MKKVLSFILLLGVVAFAGWVAQGRAHLNFTTHEGSRSAPGGGGGEPRGGGSPQSTPGTDSVGTPFLTFRGTGGSDRVTCDAIDTRFKLVANGGRIHWMAEARPAGVVLEPSSGVLDQDQSEIIHVGGTSTGSFSVSVQAPNRTGSGAQDIPFTCSGR